MPVDRVEREGIEMIHYLQRMAGEIPDSYQDALKTWRRMSPAQIDHTYKTYHRIKIYMDAVNAADVPDGCKLNYRHKTKTKGKDKQ